MKLKDIDYHRYIEKAIRIKDNDYCWCGSRKRYDECHKKITLSRNSKTGEVEHVFISLLKRKMCLYPDKTECSGKIIDAHSIQNKKSISAIACDGHVGKFVFDFYGLENYKKYQTIIPQKIGVNQVSTFKGFCSFHDNKLFEDIDKKIIVPTEQQSALLSLRSIAKEIYLKSILSDQDKVIHKAQEGENIFKQAKIEEIIKLNTFGNQLGVRDLFIHYNKLFDVYKNNQYSLLKRTIIKIDKIPEVMCSSCIIPEYDLKGNILQKIDDFYYVAEIISVEILSNGTDGIIQFCWFNESKACTEFINSILEQKDLGNTIIKFIFAFIENHAFSLAWWNNLSVIKQKTIMKYLSHNTFDDVQNINYLVNDHKKYVNWNIVEIITN